MKLLVRDTNLRNEQVINKNVDGSTWLVLASVSVWTGFVYERRLRCFIPVGIYELLHSSALCDPLDVYT